MINSHALYHNLAFDDSEVVASEKQLITVFAQRNRPKQGASRAERAQAKAATMRRWRDVRMTMSPVPLRARQVA